MSTPRDERPTDPVLARRAAILKWSDLAQRVAYVCFGASIVVFVIAFVAQFPTWTVTTVVALLAVGSILFIPAVVLGYAAKAADKEDRGEKWGY
ncbi:MAG: hypothetical protein JST64_07390 [Actinobacteria bacterium]|nr:hypothetical protein [Actinomycetota bacterium]